MVVASARTSTTARTLARLEPVAWGVFGLVLVVVGWWIVVALEWVPRSGLPGPGSVASAVSELVRDSEFRSEYFDTIYSWAKSLVYASLIGVAVGAVVGWFPLLSKAFTLPMHLCRSIPSTTLIPIAIVLFGLGSMMKVVIVTYAMAWLIVVNTIYGVQSVDRMTVQAARAMRFRQWDTFKLVLLPSAAPTILTGIRVAAGVGFVVTLGAELLGATHGVGTLMLSYQNADRPNFVYAGVLLVSFTGMLINFGMQAVERRLTPWQHGRRR